MKIDATVIQVRVDSQTFSQEWTLLSSETPMFRLGEFLTQDETNSTEIGGNLWVDDAQAYSTGNGSLTFWSAGNFFVGGTGISRFNQIYDLNGPIHYQGGNQKRMATQSIGPQRFDLRGWDGSQNFVDSSYYRALAISGLSAVWAADFDNEYTYNVNTYSTASVGFSPDLIYVRIQEGLTDNEFASGAQGMGGWYVPSKNRGVFWGTANANVVDDQWNHVLSERYLIRPGQDKAKHAHHEVVSISATQFSIEVTSESGVVTAAQRPRAAALKLPAGYAPYIGTLRAPSTSGIYSYQTNSISIMWMDVQASENPILDDVRTYHYRASRGWWTQSRGENVKFMWESEATGDLAARHAYRDGLLVDLKDKLRVYSTSVGSNGWSAYHEIGSTDIASALIMPVGIGLSVAAPNHLMDANSKSIFLADDSDYNDNLLLVSGPAITSSTLKAGYWSGQWLNASWVESFSNVGTPILSARFWPSITDFGTWDPGFPFGMQWFNGTTGRGLAGLWNLHPAGTSPTRRGWTTDSGDIYLIDPDNGNTFKGGLGSLDNNAINWQELDALGGGYDYQSIAITGSLSYETNIGDVVVTSDTQATVMSTAWKPDIVFIHMPHAGAISTRSEQYAEALGFSYGIWEARSGFGRFINGSIFNDMDGAGTDPMNTYIGSAMIYLGGSIDINVKYDVTSVGDAGFYIKTTTVNTLLSGNGASRPVYAALKFDDPTIQWKLVDFSLPSSSATQTISLGFAPKIAWTFGTNVKTLDYFEFPTSTAHRRNEGFFQGFWVESGGEGTHALWIQALQTNQDTDHIHIQSGFGRLYAGAAKVLQAEMNSVSVTGSTNLSYYAKINSVGADLAPNDAKGFMLVIGVNENLGVGSSGPDFKIGSCYYAVMSNPGYEEGNLNGWTVIGNTTASSFASLTGKEGNYFAIAGTSGQTAIWYQDYDIPNSFGVSSGNLMVSLSALFSDAAASGEDHGHMQIAFLNSSSQLMAATATKTDSSGFRGLTNTADSTDMVPVPPGTTKVRVGFSAGDGTGDTQLSFYVDTTTMVFCVGSKWYRQVTPNNGHFADLAITGWTQKTGTTLAFSGGVIQSDWRANGIVPSYTYGSGLNSAEIAQGVDIASYGNLYQQIDTGSAYFELRYFLSGVAADGGRVGVRFMNAGSTVLGSYSLISTTAFPSIITSVVCATTTIPASTRIIGYHIHHDTGGAGNIDYYPTALNGVVVVNSPFDAAVASTPSSSGPAAGGALFRSQPVTDNRDFPTPLTNVRAFPSD